MRIIRKTVPARVSTSYQCCKCKIKYKSAEKARDCESMPVESRLFKIGDRVTRHEMRTCSSYAQNYLLKGRIVKILGPQLPDEEYNIKWLGSRLSGKHVFMYQVAWICPYCKKRQEGRFYGMELEKEKRKKINTRFFGVEIENKRKKIKTRA